MKHFQTRSLLLTLLALAPGCAIQSTSGTSYLKSCVLPKDQLGTLSGRWKAAPIPVAFHNGDFSSAEITMMMSSVNTWNAFFTATQGLTIFDAGTTDSPHMSNANKPDSSSVCTSGVVTSTGYNGQIVIYKDARWPFTSQPKAIAITSLCKGAGSPLPYFYMAIMELNYQSFFVTGTEVPDLQSIVTHELGHLAGLGHTCEGSAATGIPACSTAGLPAAYRSASLFPTFDFYSNGQGIPRTALNDNDQGRGNCLYYPGGTTKAN